MGRHSAPAHPHDIQSGAREARPRSRRRFLIGIVSGAVAVVLIAVGGAAWAGGLLGSSVPSFADAIGCGKPTTIRVVADPKIAPVLTKAANSFDVVTPCVKTTVRAQDSADTASIVAAGGDVGADVWVPDSPGWQSRIAATALSLGRESPNAVFEAYVATTPLVFAAPSKKASSIAAAKPTWAGLYSGDLNALLPDPEANGASLLALSKLNGVAPAGNDLAFDTALVALGKNIPATAEKAFAAAEENATPSVVLTTEQAVYQHNRQHPAQQFFAIYPGDGTDEDAFPFARVAGRSTGSVVKDRLMTALESAFVTDQKHLAEGGFRSGLGQGHLRAAGVLKTYSTAAPGGLATQVDMLHEWSTMTMRGRMLALVDVSGSMNEDAGGTTRIGIFQQAAAGAIEMFSPQTQLGVWSFSTNQQGSQPWTELTPVAPVGDSAHAADISNVINSLPSRVQGDTALYDSVLAAVKNMQANYVSGMVSSVLVITDGKNDNPAGGLSLDQLVGQLKSIESVNRPVPVIMIGFGPDTDQSAMKQIADATGGGVYQALRPQDLGAVLVDAISQRTCRPHCGN
ncbi:VWA domain-containing protein [Rathayibacter sp. CAU 1779]